MEDINLLRIRMLKQSSNQGRRLERFNVVQRWLEAESCSYWHMGRFSARDDYNIRVLPILYCIG
jgi:hypothetical protein